MAKTALTAENVRMRCKVERLENVQKMNVWGSDIEDVRVLREMPNLEVISLSVNKITSLKDFQNCLKMKELYLRKNLISDMSEIRYLQNMPGLKVLWLLENPCADIPNYRLQVIKMLPSLEKLDNQSVTPDERATALNIADEVPRTQGPQAASPSRRDSQRPKTTESGGARGAERPAFMERSPANPERAPGNLERGQPAYERPSSSGSQEKPITVAPPSERPAVHRSRAEPKPSAPETKNENLICAVLALLKELDNSNLELVRKEIDKRTASR